MSVPDLRQEWKDEYLSTLQGGYRANVDQVFRVVKKYEEESGKDVALMTTNELLGMIRRLCECAYQSYDSRKMLLTRLRVYAAWLVDNGKINENQVLKIKESNLSDVVHVALKWSMVGSSRDLSQILSTLNFKDFPNRSSRLSIIAWLLFSGLLPDDIVLLNKADIDYERGVVTSTRRRGERDVIKVIEIDDEIMRLWDICTGMECVEVLSTYNTPVAIPLRPSPLLISPTSKNSELTGYAARTIIRFVSDLFEEYDERRMLDGRGLPPRKVSPLYLWKSGMFYRAWQEECQGECIDNDFLYKMMGEAEGMNKRSFSNRNSARDYMNWKVAFGYK